MRLPSVVSRSLYLGYYLKNLNWAEYRRQVGAAHRGRPAGRRPTAFLRSLASVYRYNIAPLEFFQFRFAELSASERETWAGTGFMYEYQRQMNPPEHRAILDDKQLFARAYAELIRHRVLTVDEVGALGDAVFDALGGRDKRVVFKTATGKCGNGVSIEPLSAFETGAAVMRSMEERGYDLLESFISQHENLMRMSPSGVNTVRVITQLRQDGEVDLLGVRLRISVDSDVDNLAAGNIAAPVDPDSGVVSGAAVYSDPLRQEERVHPVTGTPIVGFQIPYWPEVIDLAKRAAKLHRQNRSIGWDIAVTDEGPDLIEGNHDWCKLVWQLPVHKGLKPVLLQYLEADSRR